MCGRSASRSKNITQLAGQMQSAKSSLDRVFEVLDEQEEVQTAEVKELAPLTGQVSFKMLISNMWKTNH